MIKSFAHKGLQAFFETGARGGIVAHHADKLRLQLSALNQVRKPDDVRVAGWCLHSLSGKLHGHWSLTVNANWRLTFRFEEADVFVVNYQDYH